ncbi:hypothetical protein E2562_035250 [Oryza meyeriana var. granulata]|uniref:Uncharacterized protein n=1 Tax=Oryza meyeriana var. granulata TaxID=110450 RepID=A0A6G1CKW7_9ORYZ|nr:hypothetical protein E2562_035250 [Oryza meyeriana var. granulata]
MGKLRKKRDKEEGGMGIPFMASWWRFEAGARRILRESGHRPTWASQGCGARLHAGLRGMMGKKGSKWGKCMATSARVVWWQAWKGKAPDSMTTWDDVARVGGWS